MKFIKKAKRGFTLVELVVVIAVIAILAAVSVGAYFGITDSANKSKLESEARGVLTNIQLIANGNDSNSYMDKEAVHIKEVDAFERKLNGMSGIDYEVTTEMPTSISKETVYLLNTKEDQPSNAPNDTFGTYYRFGYYTPDVGGKCAVYTFATQEMKITDANFDVNEDEGGNEDGETATPVESINVTGVGSSIELHVNELSPQIFVTREPEEAQIEYRYDSSIISWDTSFIKGLKAGSTNFEILDKANGTVKHSIAVTVKEKTAESLAAISGSAETDYFTGDVFDIGSLKLGVVYSDSPTPVEITDTENIKYSTEPLTKSGNVVLSYAVGTKELTYAIAVTVTPIEIETFVYTGPEITKQFYVGDTFDLTDLTFKAEYNDSRKNKENLTLSDVQAKDTELSLGKNYISYEYEGLECKISIPAVKAVELSSLTAVHKDGKPEYNIGDTVTIEGWTVTATFNNGDEKTFTDMVEGLEIYPKEALTAESTHIKFSYKFGEQAVKYTPNLPIHVINEKTVYFEDKPWWHQADSHTYVQAYINNEKLFEDTEYGKRMEIVDGSEIDITGDGTSGSGTAIYYIENIDFNKVEQIEFKRVGLENDKTTLKDYGAITERYEISALKEGNFNILYLSSAESWESNTAKASLSPGVYKEPVNLNVYLRGLDGTDNLMDENKMTYDYETKSFIKTGVQLNYDSKFDIFVEHHNKKYGFDKLTENQYFESIDNKIRTTLLAAGKYDIKITANDVSITLTPNPLDEIDLTISGTINGSSQTIKGDNTTNREIFVFTEVTLKKGDKFNFPITDTTHKWGHSNLIATNSNRDIYFSGDNNNYINYKFSESRKFTFTINIKTHEITYVLGAINESRLFLKPNENWVKDGARFAVALMNTSKTQTDWKSMTDSNSDGIYEVSYTKGTHTYVIFCRMNGGTSANNWDNRWNQTSDLSIPTGGNNYYTVKAGTWDKGGGTWAKI